MYFITYLLLIPFAIAGLVVSTKPKEKMPSLLPVTIYLINAILWSIIAYKEWNGAEQSNLNFLFFVSILLIGLNLFSAWICYGRRNH